MTKRFALMILVLTTLLGLLLYSKWKTEPPRASGFIEADEIRLGSRVGGRVAAVHVEEGETVQAGQLLVELEPFDLLERERQLERELAAREAEYQRFVRGYRDEEIAQAKAKLAELQARLDELQAGPRAQEIEVARGRLALAQAEHKLAEQALQRVTRLAKENATSQQEVDVASERWEVTSANVFVRQQELDLLLAGTRDEELRQAAASVEAARQAWQLMQHGYRDEEMAQAEAARDAAQAALEAIRQQKKELQIRSPLDGVVEALELQPGDMVATGAPVLSMLNPNDLWVRAFVPQNRIGVQVGEPLRITVDSYPDEDFQGVVSFVARQAEFTPSNVQTPEERAKQVFRIKVDVSDPQGRLRPGMTADVWLDEASGPK